MEFVGVTTASSSIMALFPVWARELGIDARAGGPRPAARAPPEAYREAVERVRDDPGTLGALVTTHKLAVLEGARDLFDELDPNAERLGEVSSISKRDGRLIGHAFDPITAGYALGRHPRPVRRGGRAVPGRGRRRRRDRPPPARAGTGRSGSPLPTPTRNGSRRSGRLGEVQTARADARARAAAGPAARLAGHQCHRHRQGPPGLAARRTARASRTGRSSGSSTTAASWTSCTRRGRSGVRVQDGWLYFLYGWSPVIAEVFGSRSRRSASSGSPPAAGPAAHDADLERGRVGPVAGDEVLHRRAVLVVGGAGEQQQRVARRGRPARRRPPASAAIASIVRRPCEIVTP